MNEHVYTTETGERVRERDGLVEVGLSPEAQAALGRLLHLHAPKIGDWVNAGDKLFVVEGTLTAAEFYSAVSGQIVSCAENNVTMSDWLVMIRCKITLR